MRKKLAIFVAAVSALATLTVAQPLGFAPSAGAASTIDHNALGMRTNGGFLRMDAFTRYEKLLGQQIKWHVAMADKASPDKMRSSVFGQMQSDGAPLPQLANRLSLVMSVPLAFGKANAHSAAGRATVRKSLLATARGAHDDAYRNVAQNLIAGGYPDAVIRLGHEFSGPFYPWSAQGNADAYIQAFRHVADVFESESRQFQFEWNAARNTWTRYGPPAYPGDAYVDIVGIDIYYEPWKGDNPDFTDSYWQRRYWRVLDNHRDFAVARGKTLSYAEWAVGGVDQPKFIEKMHQWFASLPRTGPGSLTYHSYFGVSNKTYNLDNYPKSKAAFLKLFGKNSPAVDTGSTTGGSTTGSTTGGSTTPTTVAPTTTAPSAPSGGPSISAPPSVATRIGEPITIDATVVADTVVWWKLSGPGGISWTNRRSEDPTVKMNVPGTYVLKVAASTGTKRVSATVDVVVGGSDGGTASSGGAFVSPPANGSLPTLTIRDASAREGSSLPFRVDLSSPAPAPVRITLSTSDGTAVARQDYRPRTVDVVIPAGSRRVWVGVGTIADGRREPVEKMTLRITSLSGATADDRAATGSISS